MENKWIHHDSSSDDDGPPILERQVPLSDTSCENELLSQTNEDPPPDTSGDEVYEVEKILKKRQTAHGIEYLVKWVGWSVQESTWEPKHHLKGATESIKLFEDRHLKKTGRGRRGSIEPKSEPMATVRKNTPPFVPPPPAKRLQQIKKEETNTTVTESFEPQPVPTDDTSNLMDTEAKRSESPAKLINIPPAPVMPLTVFLDEISDISTDVAKEPPRLFKNATETATVSQSASVTSTLGPPEKIIATSTVTPTAVIVTPTVEISEDGTAQNLISHEPPSNEYQRTTIRDPPQCINATSRISKKILRISSVAQPKSTDSPILQSILDGGCAEIPTSSGPSLNPMPSSALPSPSTSSPPQNPTLSTRKPSVKKILFVKTAPNPDDGLLYLADFTDSTRRWINSARAAVESPFELIEYLQSLIHFQGLTTRLPHHRNT